MEKTNYYLDKLWEMIIVYAPKVVLAFVVLWVGLRLIIWAVKLIELQFDRNNTDKTLRPFLKSIIGALLKTMLFISVFSMLGIETTSFIAVLGAAGLAVGFALQGTLSIFAGGVLLLLLKPFPQMDIHLQCADKLESVSNNY